MKNRGIATAGALLAGTGVMLGAFGAHGLRAVLTPQQLGWWETAVQYQMWHAIGLLALAALAVRGSRWIALLLGIGTLFFSGSLYLMALTDMRWLGAVTPFGGTAIILGWLLLAWKTMRTQGD